CQQHNSNPLTF
nr:immunoglobulin light chain junction region [Macaca mulatta]